MKIDERHGGPYDRGRADSYYGRDSSPHYFKGDTYNSEKVEALTAEELRQYNRGYAETTDRKDWGGEL